MGCSGAQEVLLVQTEMRKPCPKTGCPGCAERDEEIKILNKKFSKVMVELEKFRGGDRSRKRSGSSEPILEPSGDNQDNISSPFPKHKRLL